ncbi:DUF2316 family protein [Pediococcus argentinicus]|uniref:DUF2316 family protein n=1 Tax=Pediococcus argentinicus TaxID=480391 RepID=UPI00338D471F
MCLNPTERANTIKEFQENLKLSGLSVDEIADALNTTPSKITLILNLEQSALEDPWIVRNFLIQVIEQNGQTPVTFTALKGDWHNYWFLNSRVTDKQKVTNGDY